MISIPRAGRLAMLVGAVLLLAAAAKQPAWQWHLATDIAPPPVPADNPMNPAKVALGRRLFYDADLSRDGTMSCGTCHEQHRGFADGNPTHAGVDGSPGRRNAMALANAAYLTPLTWADPHQGRFEEQALVPMFGKAPVEMGLADAAMLTGRLERNACYRALFASAFPDARGAISVTMVTHALASFERTLLSFESPWDLYAQGKTKRLEPAAERGAALFFGAKPGCASCHSGPSFSDGAFHIIAPAVSKDAGLREKTGRVEDQGAFRTPGLRNVNVSAPYLHDGSAATLGAAIDAHRAIALDGGKKADIIAFLQALTDRRFLTDPRFAQPRQACDVRRDIALARSGKSGGR